MKIEHELSDGVVVSAIPEPLSDKEAAAIQYGREFERNCIVRFIHAVADATPNGTRLTEEE